MLFALKNRLIVVKNPETGDLYTLQLEVEGDGTLVVADAQSSMPDFVYRIRLDEFPTDEVLCRKIGAVLGGPCQLVSTLDRNIELDSSALSGLKKMPVDIFDNVYLDEVKNEALVLCVDVRNFSNFLRQNIEDKVFRLIKDFTSNILSCVNQFGFGCSYYKLMGDGALIIWDDTNEQSITEALLVFDTYLDFVNEELFKPYRDLGFAGALVTDKVFKYEISAEASQLKYRDYVGYGINLACRIQGLAKKDQLIINHKLAGTGMVPYRAVQSQEYLDELHLLKGLKEEDCGEILFYDPSRI